MTENDESYIIMVKVHVKDQYGDPVVCDVTTKTSIGSHTMSTDNDGITYPFVMRIGTKYTVNAIPPHGYISIQDSAFNVMPTGPFEIHLRLSKILQVDPCEDVICKDICIGTYKYSMACVDGSCVRESLIESNSPDCPGYDLPHDDEPYDAPYDDYIPPTPPKEYPEDIPLSISFIILAIIFGAFAFLLG